MNNYQQAQKTYDRQEPPDFYGLSDYEPDVPKCCYLHVFYKCRNIVVDDGEYSCSIGVIIPWEKQTCKRRNQ